jgi:tetratricopeptide (TPR) repeat protein
LTENRSVPFFFVPFFAVPCFVVSLLLIALGSPLAGAASKTTVEDIDRMLDAGAVLLALRVIEQEQPKFSTNPVPWQHWEQRRLAILEFREDWSAVIGRIAKYPSSLPDDFRVSAGESAARAYLAEGDAEAATAVIAGLIWGTAQDTAMTVERTERLTRWRAQLAESYLLAGQLPDARSTVLRYRLDYGSDPEGWRLAHAKGLMRAGHLNEARELLVGLDSTEVAYLKLLLRARSISVEPVELLSEMGPFLGGGRLLGAERAQLWAALAGVAARYRDHEVGVTAMEQAVALRAPIAASSRFISVNADALWDAYGAYAVALANDSHLLVGRFDAWLALAEQYSGSGDVRARAMYAYLSTQQRDLNIAGIARKGLVSTLAREPRGLAVLSGLYLESSRYPEISAVPPSLRAPLIAYAVGASRRDLAGKLLPGLDAAARHGLALEWRAPVAVALIGTKRVDEAVALFDKDLVAGDGSPRMAVDAAVRVALALQVAGEYAHAATLLSRALAMAGSPWERRELLSLAAQAESHAGNHVRAARLYIESAAVPAGGPTDMWSWSASLQAAGALRSGGLDEDAVGVLKATLSDSPQPEELEFVEHALRHF